MADEPTRLEDAPDDAITQVADRRDKLIVYSALLRRWLVRSGKDNPDLAHRTLLALFGGEK